MRLTSALLNELNIWVYNLIRNYMKPDSQHQLYEDHPLLPSGQCEGFYCYHYNNVEHRIKTSLNFNEGKVLGSGVDDIAHFTLLGDYDIDKLKLVMLKSYTSHKVLYQGDIDENGIWGTWRIDHKLDQIISKMSSSRKSAYLRESVGGFHLWPSSKSQQNASQATNEEYQVLQKLINHIISL